MSGYFGGDDTSPDIIHIRESEVLGRGDIAQEVCTGHSSQSSTDGSGNVIIPRTYIRHERSKNIKWRPMTELLLENHVGLDLVQRNMTRSLNHDLDTCIPCPKR